MLFSLLKYFGLSFIIYYLTLVTKCCLNFFNRIISVLNIVFFFYLVNFFLHIDSYYTHSKLD